MLPPTALRACVSIVRLRPRAMLARMSKRLAEATSPYLQQHADNPVDWYPWGAEALIRARAEDKPILLSVGYSACHWCHVMAHESFENATIAALMNAHFINIKVDREERPDIDVIYQKVVALMGQGGGWPLTVFLTPDQRPFYGGTYFPPRDGRGRPGFARVLTGLADLWVRRRDEAEKQASSFMEGFADIARGVDEDAAEGVDLSLAQASAFGEAAKRLVSAVDGEWGGFGSAPKFPNVPGLRVLLAQARQQRAGPAADALERTLEKMWRGGIYDHLRGGFARYSTDREWLIPHFEKMLYDNGLLLELYAEASGLFERPYMRRVVEESADYLVAEMREPGGGFYSATDADSEGVEGKYFCWTPAQLREVLGDEALAERFAAAYGVREGGNFEGGMSALHLPEPLSPDEDRGLAGARTRLLAARAERVAPQRDDKLLTAWNAAVISGFCAAASAAERWGEPARAAAWVEVAQQACARVLELHRDAEGRLLRASWAGVGHTRAYLEDLALLARACLDLHGLCLEPRWHEAARSLAAEACDHYAREGGGFFITADDGEALIERSESQHDSPLPSGLAVIVEVLARLELGGAALGAARTELSTILDQTLSRFPTAQARPFAFAGLVGAARWAGERATHVTIRAQDPGAAQALARVVRRARASSPDPITLSFGLDPSCERAEALVCRARVCSLPLSEAQELREQLGEARSLVREKGG